MANISFEKIIKSYKLNTSPQDKPLFFNHIAKTGGTTFSGVLFSIGVHHNKMFQHIPKKYGDKRETLIDSLKYMRPLVFACESKYGFHHEFDTHKPFNLVTVVRDPIDRVVSDYFWLTKKQKSENDISALDFQHFLTNEQLNRKELCTQYIYGYDDIDGKPADEILDICKQNLNQYFAYCSTENMDLMASYILSHYQSASILFNDMKKESDPRKHFFKQQFSEQILQQNPLDYALYQYVKQQESKFILQTTGLEPNPKGIAIINKYGKTFDFVKLSLNFK